MNLGHVTENDFKESDSVSIAKKIIEEGRKCKTHFLEMDRTPNFDGRVSILQNGFERLIVDIQIKTLPQGTVSDTGFKFVCDTKIFNCVKFRVTANPVALFVVDIEQKRLFFKVLTNDYMENLNINNEDNKTISFSIDDQYSDDTFIKQSYRVAKITVTDVDCDVKCAMIRKIIRNAKRNDNWKNPEENLVYTRGMVKGYLAAFRIKVEGGKRYRRNGTIRMCCGEEEEIGLIHFEKGYVRITRQPSDSNDISDADYGNIVLEIAKEVEKEDMPVLYFHEGPVYWFEGTLMYQMRSEFIRLPWYMRN